MENRESEVLTELIKTLAEFSDQEIAELVEEAREGAYTAVKARIQAVFEQQLLEKVMGQAAVGLTTAADKLQDAPSIKSEDERAEQKRPQEVDRDAVRAEIEAIRAQLAANDELLSRQPLSQDGEPAPKREPLIDEYGLYLYGVIGGDVEIDQQLDGISPDSGVRCVAHVGLQVLVSRINLTEFGVERMQNAELEWVSEKAQAHQDVLAAVLTETPVIPLRFGTICREESDVVKLLIHYAPEFKSHLKKFKARQEWGVKIYFSGDQLRQLLVDTQPELQAIQAEIDGRSEGTAYMLRKKFDSLVDEAMETELDSIVADCHEQLSAVADEVRVNPLPSPQLTGKAAKALLNGAYLIQKKKVKRFEQVAHTLVETYASLGCEVQVSGPWPPYNFVQLSEMGEGSG